MRPTLPPGESGSTERSGFYTAQPAPGWALASARKTYGGKRPLRNHFLSKGNDGVPIEAVINVLAACQNIRSAAQALTLTH